MSQINPPALSLDSSFLERYDRPGPRYTSYPPAPHFTDKFELDAWKECLQNSNSEDRVSFYFHIPFCPHRCLYCGCNTEIGARMPEIETYHQAMKRELAWVLPLIHSDRKISQIHFGGGTPNFVPLRHLEGLLVEVKGHNALAAEAEIAIECDPNHLNLEKLNSLRQMGINRVSLGIQDFDPKVLELVERKFPTVHPKDYVTAATDLGFDGLNIDLIYGLPGQTPDSFEKTLEATLACKPSRIAIFSYAHVPWLKPHQQVLEGRGLPTAKDKWEMLARTHKLLTSGGYIAIGMDHYALPHDALAKALQNGTLHRNFQGYCTKETTAQVVAIGASAISQLSGGYAQNIRDATPYVSAIQSEKWPVEKAYFMTAENHFYREVVNGLMCRGVLSIDQLASKFDLSIKVVQEKCSLGWEKLPDFAADGLVEYTSDEVKVTPLGWMVVRIIAMAFDPLQKQAAAQYSRTV